METANSNLSKKYLPIGLCNKLDYEESFVEPKVKFKFGGIDSVEALNYLVIYINKNKEQLEKIIALLEKIRSLGFDEFGFKENLDFTTDKYVYSPNVILMNLYYFDNMEGVFTYYDGSTYYKSSSSNYRIELVKDNSIHNGTEYTKKIILNSLLFDSSRLPDKVTEDDILLKIISIADNIKPYCQAINRLVWLSIDIRSGRLNLYNELRKFRGKRFTIHPTKTALLTDMSDIITPEILDKGKRLIRQSTSTLFLD